MHMQSYKETLIQPCAVVFVFTAHSTVFTSPSDKELKFFSMFWKTLIMLSRWQRPKLAIKMSLKAKKIDKQQLKCKERWWTRNGAEEKNGKVEKNIGEEIEEKKSGNGKSSSLCWHMASSWTERQLVALRLLTASSSECSLCINQISILQNQHLYNQYNKYVSMLTRLNRTMCYNQERSKQLSTLQAEGQQHRRSQNRWYSCTQANKLCLQSALLQLINE